MKEQRHMEESAEYEERAADKTDRSVARRGRGKSSLWLPNNLLVNSRYYIPPEYETPLPVRTLSKEEIKQYEARLLATRK